MSHSYAYGFWLLVFINSAIFIFFAYSFTTIQHKTDWRAWGPFSAFVIAFFTEMYGFPLSIYLLSGWLANNYPGVDFYSHENGHLLHTLFRLKGDAHFDIFHMASNILMVIGFIMVASAWNTLYKAQRNHKLATTGLYSKVRHPQYVGFIIIMFGFLLQWPTIPTLIMFPILVYVYIRLAYSEEKIVMKEFGDEYKLYAKRTPAFIPGIF